jgi:hypothetical protein
MKIERNLSTLLHTARPEAICCDVPGVSYENGQDRSVSAARLLKTQDLGNEE